MTTGAPPTKRMIVGTMADIIATVDQHARALNRRWGFNRLPHIVPIEWTEKFKSQKRKWEMACYECTGSPVPAELERVRGHGQAMLRAYDKLEELARAGGHEPADPGEWQFELKDGTPVLLVRDRAEMGQVQHPHGGQVWALEEIAEIITRFPELVKAKELFPDAEVIQMRTGAAVHEALDTELSDIPF
jgi:hypothetical protein